MNQNGFAKSDHVKRTIFFLFNVGIKCLAVISRATQINTTLDARVLHPDEIYKIEAHFTFVFLGFVVMMHSLQRSSCTQYSSDCVLYLNRRLSDTLCKLSFIDGSIFLTQSLILFHIKT